MLVGPSLQDGVAIARLSQRHMIGRFSGRLSFKKAHGLERTRHAGPIETWQVKPFPQPGLMKASHTKLRNSIKSRQGAHNAARLRHLLPGCPEPERMEAYVENGVSRDLGRGSKSAYKSRP